MLGVSVSEGWRVAWRPCLPQGLLGATNPQRKRCNPSRRLPNMVYCLSLCRDGSLLGFPWVNSSVACEFVSVLSYHRFVLNMFVLQYCLLLGMSYCIVYYFFLFSTCSLFWLSCQYLPSDWLEILL